MKYNVTNRAVDDLQYITAHFAGISNKQTQTKIFESYPAFANGSDSTPKVKKSKTVNANC